MNYNNPSFIYYNFLIYFILIMIHGPNSEFHGAFSIGKAERSIYLI